MTVRVGTGLLVLVAACGQAQEGALGMAADSACVAPTAALALDHVVVAVHDLDGAVADYRAAGFTLKSGRRHDNGLLNAHAKFRDSTEVELMSLAEPPGDRMARSYAAFLEGGEGGAYLALGGNRDAILEAAHVAGLEAHVSSGLYVGFVGLPQIFAWEPFPPPADPDSIFTHDNGAAGLVEVWIEGGEALERLLDAAGAVHCGPAAAPAGEGSDGTAYALARGRVIVVPPRDPARTVVRGVRLRVEGKPRGTVPAGQVHGIWIAFSGIEGRE